jgi:hypothetical protein
MFESNRLIRDIKAFEWHEKLLYTLLLSLLLISTSVLALSHGVRFDAIIQGFDKNDTFMDFFNVVYDAQLSNPYDMGTIYPPFCYLILRIIARFIPADSLQVDGFAIRESQAGQLIFFVVFALLLALVLLICSSMKKGSTLNRVLFVVLMLFSSPFLFSIERGNIILFALLAVAFFVFNYQSENKGVREAALIALAIAANIKIYPALFGLLLILDGRHKEALRCCCYGLLLFIVPFIFYGGIDTIPFYFQNVFSETSSVFNKVGFSSAIAFSSFASVVQAIITGTSAHLSNLAVLFGYFLGLICLMSCFFTKTRWLQTLLICTAMCGMFTMNYQYVLVFMIVPLVLFLNEKHKKNYIYVILVLLLAGMFLWVPVSFYSVLDNIIPHEQVLNWRPYTLVTLIEQVSLFLMPFVLLLAIVTEKGDRKVGELEKARDKEPSPESVVES